MRIRRHISPLYLSFPLILIAALALARYSYRNARQLAQNSEASVIDGLNALGDQTRSRVESFIIDSDRELFNLVDLEHLQDFKRRWSEIVRLSNLVETAIVLDENLQLVKDGYVTKKPSRQGKHADTFQRLFTERILPMLPLTELRPGQHRHLHTQHEGIDYLLSYIKRHDTDSGRVFYIILKVNLDYLVGTFFPEVVVQPIAGRVLVSVLGSRGEVVYGQAIKAAGRYVYDKRFDTTIYQWRLLMAPLDSARLRAGAQQRVLSDTLLIGLMLGVMLLGTGFLVYAISSEQKVSALKSEFISNVSHELKTPLTELVGIRYPVVQTGMGWVAGARLVAATSNAGGLGILASATMTLDELQTAVTKVKAATDKPFGINMRADAGDAGDRVDLLIREGVKVASFALAPKPELIAKLKDAGVVVIPSVGAAKHAKKVASWGADAVIVQGGEGGGHTGPVATTLLLPSVLDEVKDTGMPVIAAGGFFDGRGLAAALSYGAAGVAMGTRFLLTADSTVPDAVKQLAYTETLEGLNGYTVFNLGLVYLDLGEHEAALRMAHRAMALGFTRPELKARLVAAGKWSDPPEATAAASAASCATARSSPGPSRAPATGARRRKRTGGWVPSNCSSSGMRAIRSCPLGATASSICTRHTSSAASDSVSNCRTRFRSACAKPEKGTLR